MDKVAQFIIGFGGDATDLDRVFSGIKTSVDRTVADLQRTTSKIELFGDIERSLPGVQRALDAAKAKVAEFTSELEKVQASGQKAPKALVEGLATAEKAVASATKELSRQQQQLAQLDAQLTRSGVNTKALASEQARLAEASKVAADAAAAQAAKQALGLTTLKDTEAQAVKLKAAFDTLKNSGTLSASETAAAQRLLTQGLKDLEGQVSKTGNAFTKIGETKQSLTNLVAPVLAATAALAGVTRVIQEIIDTNRQFERSLLDISVVTNTTRQQVTALGVDARQLAVAFGVDLTEALKGARDLIRGGIPQDNVVDALRLAVEASKAALADLGVGVKAVSVLNSAFGLSVKQAGEALDVLNVAAKNGGPTLEEFANGAGNLGVVARAVGADFKEVIAALTVMTNATGNASESAATLAKILVNLNSDSVRKSLSDLGIAGLGVAETFAKLDAKGLNINEFLELGVANTRAAVGVGALKEAAKDLPKLLDDFSNASGATARESAKLFDTAKERLERFNAALKDLQLRLGLTSDGMGKLAEQATFLIRAIDRFSASAPGFLAAIPGTALIQLALAFRDVKRETEAARAAVEKFGADNGDQVSRAVDNAAAALARLQAPLEEFKRRQQDALAQLRNDSKELIELVERSRSNAADQLAEISKRETTEIESLQRITEARKTTLLAQTEDIRRFSEFRDQDATAAVDATIKAQVAIQEAVARSEQQILTTHLQALSQRLAVVRANEAEVSAAIAEALKARLVEAGDNELKREAVEKQLAKLQVDNTKNALELYRGHYAQLTQLSRDYIDKLRAIEGERVGFNKSIQDAIAEVRNKTLTGLEQYQAKVLQIEDAIGRAQTARVNGARDLEKQYNAEAIAGARALGEVTDKNGKIIITQQQAQSDALTLLDKVSDQYNDSLDEQEAAAKKGAKATQDGLNAVKPIIDELQGKLDGLLKDISEGVTIKINKDIQGLEAAQQALDKLAQERVVKIRVQPVGEGGFQLPENVQQVGPTVPIGGGFNRGGLVPQHYASGGSVFNPATWTKVPGVGNSDSVPAMVRTGSFVVRKAATQFYGDAAMGTLAKGYGIGGNVANDVQPALDALRYAAYVKQYMRGPFWELAVKSFQNQIEFVGKHPTDDFAIKKLLRSAREVAGDVVLSQYYGGGRPTGQTPKQLLDFEEWLMRNPSPAKKFAGGGPVGTDKVPAWLTPGETVLRPEVTRMFGGGFLNAVNQMRVPRDALANILSSIRPPAPRYFAAGGIVPGAMVPDRGTMTWAAGGINIDRIEIHTPHPINDPRVARQFLEQVREIERRAGR